MCKRISNRFLYSLASVCVFAGDREEFRNCCILFCIICIIRQNAANRTVLSPLLALFSLYLCLYTIPLRKFKTRNSIESLSCPEASGQWTADSGSLKRGNEKIFVHFLWMSLHLHFDVLLRPSVRVFVCPLDKSQPQLQLAKGTWLKTGTSSIAELVGLLFVQLLVRRLVGELESTLICSVINQSDSYLSA